LNQWLEHDRSYCDAFDGGSRTSQLEHLERAGGFYRVSRNAPLQYDEGKELKRFEPIVEIFETLIFDSSQPVNFVNKVASSISEQYGGRNVLSLTTKFLWLKYKSPIVIFDSQARKALRVSSGDYGVYYAKWQSEFEKHIPQIQLISSALPKHHRYAVDQQQGTPEYISTVCNEQWFHERVFDNYLWQAGRK
jgi:hypothetical protein